MDNRSAKEIFVLGESVAASYLMSKGYAIVATNYRSSYGEIDIIATRADTLVFIEVKTRRNHSMNGALKTISLTKQKRLSLTAQYYINQNPLSDKTNTRFDVIIAFYYEQSDTFKIHHLEDAFTPYQY